MTSLVPIVLLAAAPAADPPGRNTPPPPYSQNVWEPGTLWPTRSDQPRPHTFEPKEGDLIFFTKDTLLYALIYPLARTFHPFHSGIVVRRVTGELAVLEDGAENWRAGTLQPLPDRLHHEYENGKARIWVRKITTPLTLEQSRALTAFAEGQIGRPFCSVGRLARMTIPGRPAPRSYPDQPTWFCSEIVAQAMLSAGLFPPDRVRPERVTPYELMRDRKGVNLTPYWSGVFVYSPTQGPPPPGPRFARP